jgi:hypothetical protein
MGYLHHILFDPLSYFEQLKASLLAFVVIAPLAVVAVAMGKKSER